MTDENELRVVGDIEGALDFDKLYEVIRNKGTIVGTIVGFRHNYEADFLIDKINRIREELEDSRKEGEIEDFSREAIKRFMAKKNMIIKELIHCITRSEGLRAKVVELAIDEVIERATKN